jgi:hypothetical protein
MGAARVEGAAVSIRWFKVLETFQSIAAGMGSTIATTDSSGVVVAELGPAVGVNVVVEREGLTTVERRLSETESEVTVVLEPETLVHGRAVDRVGRPFTAGQVRVKPGNVSVPLDAEGRFVLHGIGTTQDYDVWLDGEGWRKLVEIPHFRLPASGAAPVLTVPGEASLTIGVAHRERLAPRVRACAFLLEARRTGAPWYPAASFDTSLDSERDRAEFRALYPGDYRVLARAPGFGGGMSKIVTLAGAHLEREAIVLAPGRTVSGRLLDTRGNPVAGARVGLTASDPSPALSDTDGAFVLGDLPLEDVFLTVSKDGYETETIPVPEGERALAPVVLVGG